MLENARREPQREVRRRQVDALLRLVPGEHEQQVVQLAIERGEPELLLLDALGLGREAVPHLQAIAASPKASIAARANALGEVGARDELLRETAAAALAELLPGADVDGTLAIAKALGRIRWEMAESLLIGLLAHEEEAVAMAAAKGLRAAGTARAVASLRERSGALGGAFARTARDAIAAIEARVGPIDPGRLTLVEPPASEGAVSMAQQGELALKKGTDE